MNLSLLAVGLLLVGQISVAPQTAALQPAAAQSPQPLPPGVVELYVEELHCKTCAKKLARKLYATPGVKRVRTYVKDNRAVVEMQKNKPVDAARLWHAAELAAQKPVLLRVRDRQLVAKDFAKTPDQTARAVGVRGAHR